jgi:hypothetical protein
MNRRAFLQTSLASLAVAARVKPAPATTVSATPPAASAPLPPTWPASPDVFTFADSAMQAVTPAREGDIFLPLRYMPGSQAEEWAAARSYERGNVLREDSMLPAMRVADGSVFVVECDVS